MVRLLAAALLSAALALNALPAAAETEQEVFDRIEELHGDAQGLADPLLTLVQAMQDGNASTIANLANYPLQVNANGETYDILTAADFVENFDTLVMQETRAAVARQRYEDLFVNGDGVMLANGAVWMGAVCDNDDCTQSHWAITSINN